MPVVKRSITALTVCILAAGACGCYPASNSDVSGRYVLTAEWGESTLELRRDGTLVEEAILKNGEKRRVEGKWEYKSSRLVRTPCLKITPEGVEAPTIDYCSGPADRWLTGGIEIPVHDPDYPLAYVK